MSTPAEGFQQRGAAAYAALVTERSAQAAKTVTVMNNIGYGNDPQQQLDVYLPQPLERNWQLPVLLFFHGGAWRVGGRDWLGFMAPPILMIPAIFIAATYRLAPIHRYPDQLQDAMAAVAWVYKNIARFGGDPQSIFVGGHSAGGNLACLVALRKDLYARYQLPGALVKYCFPISAPCDLSAVPTAVQESYLRNDSDWREANPLNWISADAPPFQLCCGQLDLPNILRDNEALMTKFNACGVTASSIIYEGASHFDSHAHCVDTGHPWLLRVSEILPSFSLNRI